ncbi:MAG: hypothetical protein M3273_03525 [Actinomycetota bacterium]|nr:hypothetical protein [Actinomycetota bacterium]
MTRTRVLGIFLAVSVVAAIGAGFGLISLSGRLDEAEQRNERLAAQSDAAQAEAEVAENDLEDADRRLERLAALRRSIRRLEREGERARRSQCFIEDHKSAGDVRGPIRADVDGDSFVDSVYAVGLPVERDRCTYHVAVDVGGAVATAPVRSARHATQRDELRFHLTPALFVELNGLPGYEVMVQTSQGATGAGYQLFTMTDERFQIMERPGKFGWSFGSTASAGGGSGLGCAGPARIVEGHYGYSVASEDHTVERTFYRVVGAALVLDEIETYDLPYRRQTRRFPELTRGDGVPFPNCDDRIPRYRPPM